MAIQEMFIHPCAKNAALALDFYARAFGGREKFRLSEAGGRIGHAMARPRKMDGAAGVMKGQVRPRSRASRRNGARSLCR